jgi:large subunit ribosomal protein L23
MIKKKNNTDKQEPTKAAPRDYDVLICPIFTEKAANLAGGGTCVAFNVRKGSCKDSIKRAVERVFNVGVQSVRTCNTIGKKKRVNRSIGTQAAVKKAYVTLKPGYSIDIVEGL